MHIIALTGLRRSGKDEVANYLSKNYGYTNVKFAATLKRVVKSMFDMNDDQVEGELKDAIDYRWGITPRQAMQFMGTEVMQYKIQELLPCVGRNFWAKQLCCQIKTSPYSMFAISDARFVHEIEELKSQFLNVQVVRIIRQPALDQIDDHCSEKEWLEINPNYTLINNINEPIENLYKNIDKMMESMNV